MAADRDAGHDEREDQVDDQQAEDAAAPGVDPGRPLADDGGADEREDGAGRAHREAVRAHEQRAERRRDQADQVERGEAGPAQRPLHARSEGEERDHVHAEVEHPDVQEPGGHEPPPLPGGDGLRVEAAQGGERAALQQLGGAADHQAQGPDSDVGRQQQAGDADPVGRQPQPPGRRLRPPAAPAHALDALDADGRRDHARRTDRPFAALAADAGLTVRVAVAGQDLGGQFGT